MSVSGYEAHGRRPRLHLAGHPGHWHWIHARITTVAPSARCRCVRSGFGLSPLSRGRGDPRRRRVRAERKGRLARLLQSREEDALSHFSWYARPSPALAPSRLSSVKRHVVAIATAAHGRKLLLLLRRDDLHVRRYLRLVRDADHPRQRQLCLYVRRSLRHGEGMRLFVLEDAG